MRVVEVVQVLQEELIIWGKICGGGWGCCRVMEVGAGLEAAHGTGRDVVGAGGLLSRVEGAQPPPLLRLWVSDLRRVSAPGTAADASVPHASATASLFGCGCGGPLAAGAVVFLWGVDFLHFLLFWRVSGVNEE